MLRASLLANAEILPQARQRSYFFNRIGRQQPVISRAGKSALHRFDGYHFHIPEFFPGCLGGFLLCQQGTQSIGLMDELKRLTFNCACEISPRPGFQDLVRQTVAGYRLAASSYWRPEDPSECSGGLFIQPRLQLIQIAHHDLLRRRFGVEFFRVYLKAL